MIALRADDVQPPARGEPLARGASPVTMRRALAMGGTNDRFALVDDDMTGRPLQDLLMAALDDGEPEEALALIAKGANGDDVDEMGDQTGLMIAAGQGYLAVVKALVAARA